jgi:TPR repeat protein
MQLASMYEKGTEVPRDFKAAFNWYMKAASQNSGLAQYKVGYMYEKGLGTGKNISQALHWYTQAVRNKNAAARKRLLQLKKIKDHR